MKWWVLGTLPRSCLCPVVGPLSSGDRAFSLGSLAAASCSLACRPLRPVPHSPQLGCQHLSLLVRKARPRARAACGCQGQWQGAGL